MEPMTSTINRNDLMEFLGIRYVRRVTDDIFVETYRDGSICIVANHELVARFQKNGTLQKAKNASEILKKVSQHIQEVNK